MENDKKLLIKFKIKIFFILFAILGMTCIFYSLCFDYNPISINDIIIYLYICLLGCSSGMFLCNQILKNDYKARQRAIDQMRKSKKFRKRNKK